MGSTGRALGKEIEEVKNAKAAYALLERVDPYSLKDLLKVHGLMVGGLTIPSWLGADIVKTTGTAISPKRRWPGSTPKLGF